MDSVALYPISNFVHIVWICVLLSLTFKRFVMLIYEVKFLSWGLIHSLLCVCVKLKEICAKCSGDEMWNLSAIYIPVYGDRVSVCVRFGLGWVYWVVCLMFGSFYQHHVVAIFLRPDGNHHNTQHPPPHMHIDCIMAVSAEALHCFGTWRVKTSFSFSLSHTHTHTHTHWPTGLNRFSGKVLCVSHWILGRVMSCVSQWCQSIYKKKQTYLSVIRWLLVSLGPCVNIV